MPDGTSRFSINGKPVHHYMGTSTFSNFTVLPEIAVAKIREDAPFDQGLLHRLRRHHWHRAVINTAKSSKAPRRSCSGSAASASTCCRA